MILIALNLKFALIALKRKLRTKASISDKMIPHLLRNMRVSDECRLTCHVVNYLLLLNQANRIDEPAPIEKH